MYEKPSPPEEPVVSQPLVSVCLVVCNVDRFLAESIQSIMDQSFRDFEFIIVDFGSSDRTIPIVRDLQDRDKRIQLWTIPHCGLAEARNAACEFAVGQYVAIMDADDVALPDRLEKQVHFMESHPEIGAVGGATEWIDENGKHLLIQRYSVEDRRTLKARYLPHNPFCQPSVLLRRKIFLDAGGYRAAFAPAEDLDLWFRIAERSELANLESVILKYRLHPNQISQRKLRRQTLCALGAEVAARLRRAGRPDPLSDVEDITPEILGHLGVSESAQQTALAGQYIGWVRTMYMAGDFETALKIAIEMFNVSHWELAEAWLIADAQLTMAGLFWRNKQWFSCISSATHAVVTRPLVIARPIRSAEKRIRATYKEWGRVG